MAKRTLDYDLDPIKCARKESEFAEIERILFDKPRPETQIWPNRLNDGDFAPNGPLWRYVMFEIIAGYLRENCMPLAYLMSFTCRDFRRNIGQVQLNIELTNYIVEQADIPLFRWAIRSNIFIKKDFYIYQLMERLQQSPDPEFDLSDVRACWSFINHYAAPWMLLLLARPHSLIRRIAEYHELVTNECAEYTTPSEFSYLPVFGIDDMFQLYNGATVKRPILSGIPSPNAEPDDDDHLIVEEIARSLIIAPVFGDFTGIDDIRFHFGVFEPYTDTLIDQYRFDKKMDNILLYYDKVIVNAGLETFETIFAMQDKTLQEELGADFDYEYWCRADDRLVELYKLYNDCHPQCVTLEYNLIKLMEALEERDIHRSLLMHGARYTTLSYRTALYYTLYSTMMPAL